MIKKTVSGDLARVLTALTFILCFVGGLHAQNTTSLQGSVTDEQGGEIVGADVRLLTKEGLQSQSTTDRNGVFTFTGIEAGKYLVQVKADGFSVLSREATVNRGETKQLRLELSVAAINASIVITASGTPQRADEVAKVVSTIDEQQIEAGHRIVLTEALREIPGVRVQQQGSTGTLTTVRLRGQRSFDTALLLDGLRIRDAGDINGSAASLVTDLAPVSIDQVEILRGAGSSIYGTNAIGGVINLVPSVGSGPIHFEAGAEAGGLKTFRARLQLAGGGKQLGYALGVHRLDVRSGIDGDDEYGNTVGSGRFQFHPTQSIALTGTVYSTIANARLNDSPFALPTAFAGPTRYPEAKAGFNYQPDFNNPDQGRRNRLFVGAVKLAQEVRNAISYSLTYQRVTSQRRNYNGPAIDPRFAAFYPFGDFEFTNINRGVTDTLDGRVNLRLGRANLATAGLEFENESLFQESIPSFTAFNRTTDRQRTFAVFGQDQLALLSDALQLSFGIRGQFYRIRSADRPGFLQSFKAERSLTGDGAIAYLIRSTNTKLRAHGGNGFRAPSLFERFGAGSFPGLGIVRFGDPTLKAEQSISVDGGFDQRLASDRVLLGATYFYTRLQRAVAFSGFAIDPLGLGRFSGYMNQPGGLARGLESFVEAAIGRVTNLRASYSYTNSDRSVSGQGLQPEYVIPAHLLSLSLNHRYRAFLLNLDLNRTGSYLAPVFENNFPFRMAELRFAGFTKADLFGSYEWQMSDRLKTVLFAGADNVFNQRYFENGFRAPGLVVRGGVKLKF